MVIVPGDTSVILKGTSLREINLLYDSASIFSAAEAFLGDKSMYTYCPAYNGGDALKIFMSC